MKFLGFLFIVGMGIVLVLSFVHQEKLPVDPNCEDLSGERLCTDSDVTYKLYWKPIWEK